MRLCYFELNASLRFILFPVGELEDFHRFYQVFGVSFENLGRRKVLGHWFFEFNAFLRFILFPGRELEAFHRFHQVFGFLLETYVRVKRYDIGSLCLTFP